jgi:hypothetical protein
VCLLIAVCHDTCITPHHRSGTWSDDKASGVGHLEYSNGDVYAGQWEKDQRHGKGGWMGG